MVGLGVRRRVRVPRSPRRARDDARGFARAGRRGPRHRLRRRGLGEHLLARGLRYRGVDSEPSMVAAAARRVGAMCRWSSGELDTFEPPAPVAATTVFRAIYYVRDRPAFFARVASYTERKLVFDLNPRQYRVAEILRELGTAGFAHVVMRPFFVPQTKRLPGRVRDALTAARALRPGCTAGAPRAASRTSSRRSARCARDDSNATLAPSARRSLPEPSGSISAGTNVSISTSARHGASGVGSTIVRTRSPAHRPARTRFRVRSQAACRGRGRARRSERVRHREAVRRTGRTSRARA